jgi:hypothetical protein
MKPSHFWIALLLTAGLAGPPCTGAITLYSLDNPTLATLINLGSTGVWVGDDEYYGFSFLNAIPGSSISAADIQVEPYTTQASGLQFISSWFAADGSYVDTVIAYDVVASAQPIGEINLLSNGTAPAPAPGTFTTTTLVSELANGQTADPVLSTYDDGVTYPVDTTKPDVDFAQASLYPQEDELHIIDTIFASSTAATNTSGGGVATASVIQNAFVDVPEPMRQGWIFLPVSVLIATLGRRSTRVRRIA